MAYVKVISILMSYVRTLGRGLFLKSRFSDPTTDNINELLNVAPLFYEALNNQLILSF